MTEVFAMKLADIQPSQLFISVEKLSEVMKTFDPNKLEFVEPIPVKKLKDQIVFVDGHTRALAAFIHGLSSVPVYWEHEDLDWEAYEVCVEWCERERIYTISDLKDRVIPHEKYQELWLDRCKEMQQSLRKSRQLRIKKERR